MACITERSSGPGARSCSRNLHLGVLAVQEEQLQQPRGQEGMVHKLDWTLAVQRGRDGEGGADQSGSGMEPQSWVLGAGVGVSVMCGMFSVGDR